MPIYPDSGPQPLSRTIPALLREQAARFEDAEALVGGESRYSYRSLYNEVRSFAKGLLALGVSKGSRVAILMGNKPEWVVADLAICSIGAVMVSVNTWVTARELNYILKHSDADTLIFAERFLKYNYADLLKEIEPHGETVPMLKSFIHVGGTGYAGSIPFAEVFERGRDIPDSRLDAASAAVQPEDVTYQLYTSGSTSTPKGVQLQHYLLIENMWHIGNRMHVVPGDRLWLAVSLFWGLGSENALFNLLTHGGCIVLQEFFEAGEALRLIEEERCTLFYGMPNMAQAMLEHPDRLKRDLSSLRGGGSSGSVEQMQRPVELGAKEICHMYGLTETYGNSHVSDGRLDPRDKVYTSVGTPLPGVIDRVVNPETLAPCKVGEVGEIQMKCPVTIGYYKDESKNLQAFTPDGYFRTGDLGTFDEDGYLYFRGRLKEMLKTGGINVAPAEVEDIIVQQEGVKLAYVIGVPDATRDEVVAAVIVLDGTREEAMLEQSLRTELRKSLAAYKVPRLYCFVDEHDLPLTTTGKIQKNRLVYFFTSENPRQLAH
ncbi:AMP-binding protein [Rhizobium lusitanum]|uniref:AMP-binding protein n=1 Tax=Rhizobium lusitanum TaxID=293958 RepID=A0A6L9UEJ4_9HYPH|nr:class I adenylate-forming enzyme family protein [Rhizobium lusitanum]NEI72557.1 AMP-binding protein [Rhizobium lusitanum]